MLTQLFLFILIFAALYLVKEGFSFYKALVTGEKNITNKRLIFIGCAIAYILTIIITGFPTF